MRPEICDLPFWTVVSQIFVFGGGPMAFKDRIGIDLGRSIALEKGIAWAAENDVRFFDAQTDSRPTPWRASTIGAAPASLKLASGAGCTSGCTHFPR
jgi:hypothetical protein